MRRKWPPTWRPDISRGKVSTYLKSIAINPSYLKKVCSKPAPNPSSKSAPPTTTVVVTWEPDEEPFFIDDISYHKTRKPFVIPREIREDSFECLNSSPLPPKATYVPNRKKISKILCCIIFFTERELLVLNMGGFLPGYATNPSQSRWEFYPNFHGMAFVRYSRCSHCSHPSYKGLHNFWDNESGFSCDFSRFSFNLSSHNDLCCP